MNLLWFIEIESWKIQDQLSYWWDIPWDCGIKADIFSMFSRIRRDWFSQKTCLQYFFSLTSLINISLKWLTIYFTSFWILLDLSKEMLTYFLCTDGTRAGPGSWHHSRQGISYQFYSALNKSLRIPIIKILNWIRIRSKPIINTQHCFYCK